MPIEEKTCLCGCGKKFYGTMRRKYYNDACKMRYLRRKERIMKKEYLENALVLVQKVFPSADFNLDQNIEIKHSDGIIYRVRMSRYKNLDHHDISDEQKADVIANEVVKTMACKILNKDT